MYKKKCLFRNTNGTWGKDPTAMESVWAYLSGVEKKVTGRYRIRISKMTAEEMIAMGLAPDGTPADFFGLQASLDRWHEQNGWLPMFDWVGDPESTLHKIELDLNKQFKSFVTGLAVEEDFGFDLPKPPKAKAIKLPDKPEDKINEEKSEDSEPSADEPDFEWL